MATLSADRPVRLAVVGASARAAAHSARQAGFEVVAADLFADRDLHSAASSTRITDYPGGLLAWLEEADADAWLYTGALENHPDLIDQMAAIKPLWGNRGEPLRRVRAADELRTELADAGLCFPEVLANTAAVPLDGSWLAKTRRGSSGSGVWAVESMADMERAREQGAELERRLDSGLLASAIYVIQQAGFEMLGVTQQIVGCPLAGAAPFQYAGSLWPLEFSAAVGEQLFELGRVLSERFHLHGMVVVDLWVDDRRVWVLEVNPRYSASVEVIERATGLSALANHVAAFGCSVTRPRREPAQPTPCGKLFLFAKRPVSIYQEFSDWAIAQPDLADIPHAGQAMEAGEPVLTLLAAGQGGVERLFAQRVAEVERRLYAGA